LIQSELISLI